VSVGHRTVKVDKKISEGKNNEIMLFILLGGYAFVYQVSDVNTYAQYALKKITVSVSINEKD
jgi:hypothetical protein